MVCTLIKVKTVDDSHDTEFTGKRSFFFFIFENIPRIRDYLAYFGILF